MAEMVKERMVEAAGRRMELSENLDVLTNGQYAERQKKVFSAAKKAGVDNVDWRIPRLMACKDPKYNAMVPPEIAHIVSMRKQEDGAMLENQLAYEAYERWANKLEDCNQIPPPMEVFYRDNNTRAPFNEAHPSYDPSEDDHHRKKVELRPMDQAMQGDVSQPMPAPQLFDEDNDNYREGKYVKDDCPIA